MEQLLKGQQHIGVLYVQAGSQLEGEALEKAQEPTGTAALG